MVYLKIAYHGPQKTDPNHNLKMKLLESFYSCSGGQGPNKGYLRYLGTLFQIYRV